jgi:protein TonB
VGVVAAVLMAGPAPVPQGENAIDVELVLIESAAPAPARDPAGDTANPAAVDVALQADVRPVAPRPAEPVVEPLPKAPMVGVQGVPEPIPAAPVIGVQNRPKPVVDAVPAEVAELLPPPAKVADLPPLAVVAQNVVTLPPVPRARPPRQAPPVAPAQRAAESQPSAKKAVTAAAADDFAGEAVAESAHASTDQAPASKSPDTPSKQASNGRSGHRAAQAMPGNPPPVYPYRARERGQEGRVLLDIVVAVDGTAAEVSVRTSSGVRSLDRAAVRAVRAGRFPPATRLGRPLQAALTLPVTFRLHERRTAAR